MKMAKLNMFEKESFANNMEMAMDEGIIFGQSEDKVITVAVKLHDRMNHFVRVYVAYCGNETPKRKRGINAVMNRYMNDNYILVPMHWGDTLDDSVRNMLAIIEDNFF